MQKTLVTLLNVTLLNVHVSSTDFARTVLHDAFRRGAFSFKMQSHAYDAFVWLTGCMHRVHCDDANDDDAASSASYECIVWRRMQDMGTSYSKDTCLSLKEPYVETKRRASCERRRMHRAGMHRVNRNTLYMRTHRVNHTNASREWECIVNGNALWMRMNRVMHSHTMHSCDSLDAASLSFTMHTMHHHSHSWRLIHIVTMHRMNASWQSHDSIVWMRMEFE